MGDESVVQYELRQTPKPVTESEDTEVQSQSEDTEAQSQHEAPREEVSIFGKIYNFFAGKSEDAEAQSQNSDDSEPLDDAEAQRLVDDIEWQYHNDAEVQRLINLTRHEQEQRDAENQRRQQELQEVYRISLDLQRETQERAAAEKARLAEEFAEAETAAAEKARLATLAEAETAAAEKARAIDT